MGILQIEEAPYYESEKSLKEWLRKQTGAWKSNIKKVGFIINQTGTAGDVELEDNGEDATKTIADIAAPSGVTIELTCLTGDENSHDTLIVSMTWEDANGNEFISEATGTTTLFNTPVAFADPVATSVVAVTALSISADFDTRDIIVKVHGGQVYGTITAAVGVLAATEAQLWGQGMINVRGEAADATQLGKEVYIEYVSFGGSVKYGLGTLDGADITNEAIVYEASSAYVATTAIVKDFSRKRLISTEQIVLTTKEIEVVAVGGAAIYGIISATKKHAEFSAYTVPKGRDTWLARLAIGQSITALAIGSMTMTFTPYGKTQSTTVMIPIPNNGIIEIEPCIRFAEETEVSFTVTCDGATITVRASLIEAEQV